MVLVPETLALRHPYSTKVCLLPFKPISCQISINTHNAGHFSNKTSHALALSTGYQDFLPHPAYLQEDFATFLWLFLHKVPFRNYLFPPCVNKWTGMCYKIPCHGINILLSHSIEGAREVLAILRKACVQGWPLVGTWDLGLQDGSHHLQNS